jgi:uncharacterized membrane protein YfcA
MSGPGVFAAMLALGLAAGVAAGMFGIGGGLIIVPALVIGLGLDQKTATGTSLFVILLPTGLLGVIEYYRRGELRADLGLCIALGVLLGGYAGAKFTGLMSAAQMKRAYAIFLLCVGVYYLATTRDRDRAAKPAGGPPGVPAEKGA